MLDIRQKDSPAVVYYYNKEFYPLLTALRLLLLKHERILWLLLPNHKLEQLKAARMR